MIINDLDIFRPVWRPAETDAPLPVDPDAELSYAVTLERLKLISRRRAQLIEAYRRIEHVKLARRYRLKSPPLTRADAIPKESLVARSAKLRIMHYYVIRNAYQ
jgi:hypothetical protein